MGLRTFMLTGDGEDAARTVAQHVGIKAVRARVLPADKAKAIRIYVRTVRWWRWSAMASTMPQPWPRRIGIAMGGGTDVAMETAGIKLMRGDLTLVADAIGISRRTTWKIWQGLFWAFAYNLIGIPLAAFGYLSPLLSGAAMAQSLVSVVGNALLLRRMRS